MLVGCCPIETFDFFEISRHLWQSPSKNQAFWPAGLLACWPAGLLACWPAAHCCLPWPKQPPTLKNVGALGPPSHPPWVGCCPIETLDFFEFSRHLWQFPSKNQAFWPAGLLACWLAGLLACCSLLPAMAQTTTNIEKCWGPWPPPSHPPWGGLMPHRNLRFFFHISRHLWQFPSKNQAFWPAGL